MSSEDALEQEITLLEQDYALLNETLANLQQHLTINTDNKFYIKQKIIDNEAELYHVKQRLEELKKKAGLIPDQMNQSPPATLHNVPRLPPYLVTNLPLFNELKTKLIEPDSDEISENQKSPIIIQSPSGMGKSVMAAMLAHDETIRRAFNHGIFWIHLGQQPDLLARQIALIHALNEPATNHLLKLQEGTKQLRQLCANRRCLFILDDAWDVYEILAFSALGKECQLLITTCDTTLLDFLRHSIPNAQGYILDPLEEKQAIQFFIHCTGRNLIKVTSEVTAMAQACDYSPLALKLIASITRTQSKSNWKGLLESLQRAQSNEFPDTHPRALMQAMPINVDALGEQSEYYLTLAVFIDYTHIPEATILMLWHYLYHFQAEQAGAFLDKLAEKGLLHIDGQSPKRYIRLHAFQYDYLSTSTDVDKLHGHLLTAYRRQCQHDWSSGPNDGYFFEYLCQHLLAAERFNELKSLLLDFDWLHTKLQICSLHAVLKDYELLQDADLNLVKQALHKVAPSLRNEHEQLAIQLFNHLHTNFSPDIQKLLNQMKEIVSDW